MAYTCLQTTTVLSLQWHGIFVCEGIWSREKELYQGMSSILIAFLLEAKEYFEKAAENEEAGGFYNVGVMYYVSQGTRCEARFKDSYTRQIESTDLEEWIADSSHFPCLENLALRCIRNLKEIPCGIGGIPTLRLILLEGCSDSAFQLILLQKRYKRNSRTSEMMTFRFMFASTAL